MNKEEIEKAKIRLKVLIKDECKCPECLKNKKAYKTFLQYITQLEQENKKQSKIIDEMAKWIYESDYNNQQILLLQERYRDYYSNNIKKVKQYFEKKVEGK